MVGSSRCMLYHNLTMIEKTLKIDTEDVKNDDVEDVENNFTEDIENYDVEDIVNEKEDVMNSTEDVKNNEMEKKWKVLISEFVEEIKELKSTL